MVKRVSGSYELLKVYISFINVCRIYVPPNTVINAVSVGPACEELFLPYRDDFNLLLLGVLLLGGKMRDLVAV